MAEPLNRETIRTILDLTSMPLGQLAVAARTQEGSLKGWLSPEGASLAIEPSVEAAVLKELGLNSKGIPTRRRLHHWTIRESLFRSAEAVYAPLARALALFGPATMTALLPTDDGIIDKGSVNRFVLRFPDFTAVLDVHSSAWRGCRIESISQFLLSWEKDQATVHLNPFAMDRVGSPNCTPRDLDDAIGYPPQVQTPLLENAMRGRPIHLPHDQEPELGLPLSRSGTPKAAPSPAPVPTAPPIEDMSLEQARELAQALLRHVQEAERKGAR